MECVNQILFQLVCVCSVWIVRGGSCYKNDEYVCSHGAFWWCYRGASLVVPVELDRLKRGLVLGAHRLFDVVVIGNCLLATAEPSQIDHCGRFECPLNE